jgi:hypothetical protein
LSPVGLVAAPAWDGKKAMENGANAVEVDREKGAERVEKKEGGEEGGREGGKRRRADKKRRRQEMDGGGGQEEEEGIAEGLLKEGKRKKERGLGEPLSRRATPVDRERQRQQLTPAAPPPHSSRAPPQCAPQPRWWDEVRRGGGREGGRDNNANRTRYLGPIRSPHRRRSDRRGPEPFSRPRRRAERRRSREGRR